MSNLVIEVLSSTVTTVPTAKGSYQVCELAFKNKSFQNKVEGKKIMSFAEKEAFAALSSAPTGSVFTVFRAKDDKGYWKWNSVTPGEGVEEVSAPAASSAGFKASLKSTYETPEERAARQVMIAKQSSLERAIKLFELQGNKKASVLDVIAVAQQFVDYVVGKTAALDADSVGINDDVPF